VHDKIQSLDASAYYKLAIFKRFERQRTYDYGMIYCVTSSVTLLPIL